LKTQKKAASMERLNHLDYDRLVGLAAQKRWNFDAFLFWIGYFALPGFGFSTWWRRSHRLLARSLGFLIRVIARHAIYK
jgi:hypothetical protein